MSEATQQRILDDLHAGTVIADTEQYAANIQADHQTVVGAMKSLERYPEMITTKPFDKTLVSLTEEGLVTVKEGTLDARIFNGIDKTNGTTLAELTARFGPATGQAQGRAMKNKWIRLDKASGKLFRAVETIVDEAQQQLAAIQAGQTVPDSALAELRKLKLAASRTYTAYAIGKGDKFSTKIVKPESDLTTAMLTKDAWREVTFKDKNLKALGAPTSGGYLHPLLKVRTQFRNIFLEMGFSEMPTNNFVESSFWNFDALFQPQQHPARDSHDTFFIKDPSTSTQFPEDYLKRVHEIHEKGGYGSIGYRYDWSRAEAQKNILRTHTTAVSTRMLYQLAQQKEFKPVKYFSIDRVFRNEALDATHLAEFHQIEGLVADRNLTLGDLIGLLSQFFKKMGIEKLRFKPAFNPYTEPSMEVYSYHEGLKKWVELGNSGIFRPEMLRPMGLPEDVSVIAWGLSLERPTMIKYKIDNIRALVGHKVDFNVIRSNPICRLDH
ncbi:phenylalanyl-tRNA synthetase beta subunit [Capsaspora owczarzaki ATCC 30864]|uniref:phenylalanine--tRNA ligase n=1 Tax=Capsaspora owczarzaki (strain ATCC 30864) TaxID=595528 RepID=A0A0D2X086_CAPO3|nr:phenylalanyl-tRNA synthetase beta subunit [Capsaspora owczarzaki ATCC 30864]KJE88624.1 phenylalanyl-tRNA synthetase beta subunit [Capsaspora owczarzaki ATCC 30864]|eukprot:XP_004365121.2 phenylalanyl-tRNA synthetase beta subunit [Capsaspora owczarzaki ATCC 30864]